MNPRKCTSYNGVFENDKCTIPCKLLKDNKIETTDIDFINNDKCFLTGTGSVRQINNQDQYHDIIQKHQKCFNINSKYDRNIGVSTGNGTREVIPYHIDSIPTKSQYYLICRYICINVTSIRKLFITHCFACMPHLH